MQRGTVSFDHFVGADQERAFSLLSRVDDSSRPIKFRATPFGGCTTQPGAFNVSYSGERGGLSMTDDHPTEFFCPGCGSRYKVVRVQADADLPHRLIHCKVCKQPLTPADG